MVKKYPHLSLRPAIAMIELIFALVIMGIALLSAPLILDMSVQSSNTAIQQESVAAASSKMALILTKAWDEQTATLASGFGILNPAVEDARLTAANRMTRTTRAFAMRDFNVNPATGLVRVPTPYANFGVTPAEAIPNNDIDDFDGTVVPLQLYRAAVNDETSDLTLNEGEYIKGSAFDLTTRVDYALDNTPDYTLNAITFNNPFGQRDNANSHNIKLITVNVAPSARNNLNAQAEFANENVTLYAFSCNIGNGGLTFSPTEIVAAP